MQRALTLRLGVPEEQLGGLRIIAIDAFAIQRGHHYATSRPGPRDEARAVAVLRAGSRGADRLLRGAGTGALLLCAWHERQIDLVAEMMTEVRLLSVRLGQ